MATAADFTPGVLLADGGGKLGKHGLDLGDALGERGQLWSKLAGTGPQLGFGERADLGLELGDLALQLLERGGVAGFGLGECFGDLAVEPLLGLGDLLGDGGGRGDRAAFARRLRDGLQRRLELRDAVGEIGEFGRQVLGAGLQRIDPRLELRQGFGIAGRRLHGFELGDARFQRGDVGLCTGRFAAAKAAPGKSKADDADEATEHARGEMGDEAFQLGHGRLRRRRRHFVRYSFGRIALELRPIVAARCLRRGTRLVRGAGLDDLRRGSLDGVGRTLARARALILSAERVCHHD